MLISWQNGAISCFPFHDYLHKWLNSKDWKDMQNCFSLAIPAPRASSVTLNYCQNNTQSLQNVDRYSLPKLIQRFFNTRYTKNISIFDYLGLQHFWLYASQAVHKSVFFVEYSTLINGADWVPLYIVKYFYHKNIIKSLWSIWFHVRNLAQITE